MKLPGLLLIGLTAVIIAVDGTFSVTGSSIHDLTMKTEKPLVVTGSSVHDLTITETKNPLGVKEYKRICSYAKTAQYRHGKGKFFPEDIDIPLCTHLIYSNASISDNFTIVATGSNDDGPGGMYERFNNLKKNSSVVTLLEVVLQGPDLIKMTKMLETNATRQQFINSSMDFLRKRDFDGILLTFYYPAYKTSPPEDKERFTSLLEEMDAAMKEEAKKTGKTMLILAATFACLKNIIDKAYDVSIIHKYLNFMYLMTYDIYNNSLLVTQHHSPLFAGNKTDEQMTMKWVAEYYVSKGVSKDKIVLAVAPFGRGYTLKDANNNWIGAPVVGPSPTGEYLTEPGTLPYFEICPMLNDSSVTKVFLEDEKVPYAYNDTLWIGYDDQKSMAEKAIWLKNENYAGWLVWIGMDDFNGTICNQGRYPLVKILSDTLLSSVTGHLQPLTKILQSGTTLVHKTETTTIRK